jgi:hypothetical protein
LLDDDLAVTEKDGAGASLPLAEPTTKVGEVRICIHHVPLDGLHARLVIPAIVERDPKTLELG